MRGIVRGLLIAAAAASLAAPAAIAAASQAPGSVSPAIVGGSNASETYPFMADIQRKDGKDFCGGALIRPAWVLTAIHCMVGETVDNTQIRIGSLKITSGGTLVNVKGWTNYPGGASGNLDVALVQLANPVSEKPIAIAPDPRPGPARIIGFGCVNASGTCVDPATLQQLDTSILATKCGDTWELCVNNPDGTRGACHGDSGGPALVGSPGNWALAGSTHGGPAVCGSGPSTYEKLSLITGWIDTVAGPPGTPPPGDGTNLALNRPTKSKQASCNAAETPAKIVDGAASKPADKWCSADGAAKSAEVDLGASKALTKLVVKHAGAGGESAGLNTKNFVLETSDGAGVWTTAATVTGNTASTTTTAVKVTARWIRITVTDPVARVYEFEAYA